jgi:hypothetical protein
MKRRWLQEALPDFLKLKSKATPDLVLFFFFFFSFLRQTGLELWIPLPQTPKCWDYRYPALLLS